MPEGGRTRGGRALLVVTLVMALGNLVLGCQTSTLEAARRALDEDDPERAAILLEELTREHPEEPGAWLALGRARMAARLPIAAREAFERAASLAPTSPGPRILVGHTHELERHYDEAELAYEQACALAPSSARAHRVLGVRLLRWGRAADAVSHLARAAELDPTSAATWNALAVAQFHAGDGAQALDTFARAVDDRARRGLPWDRDLAIGHAALLVRSSRLVEALAVYDEIVVHDRSFAEAHVGRALVLHELGRCAEAREAMRAAADTAGHTARADARLATYEAGPASTCVDRTPH